MQGYIREFGYFRIHCTNVQTCEQYYTITLFIWLIMHLFKFIWRLCLKVGVELRRSRRFQCPRYAHTVFEAFCFLKESLVIFPVSKGFFCLDIRRYLFVWECTYVWHPPPTSSYNRWDARKEKSSISTHSSLHPLNTWCAFLRKNKLIRFSSQNILKVKWNHL